MVYQELTLAPHLTVEANVMLGQEPSHFGFLRGRDLRRKVREVLAVLEHPEIRPDNPVEGLSPAAQQLVEIARALLVDVKVLVLDEPTSALTSADAHRLFSLVRRLRDRGVAVVYISHFLEEVEAVADRFTVLRDGLAVATGAVSDFHRDQMIEQMVGRRLAEQYPTVPHTAGEPVLELSNVAGVELPRGASLRLRRGEILGIAGIIGAGRTELLRTIYGLDPVRSGKIVVRTVGPANAHSVRGRIRQGLGFLSEDRKSEGLALDQSIEDNLTYSRLAGYGPAGWINLGAAPGGSRGLAQATRRPLFRRRPSGRATQRRESAKSRVGTLAPSTCRRAAARRANSRSGRGQQGGDLSANRRVGGPGQSSVVRVELPAGIARWM